MGKKPCQESQGRIDDGPTAFLPFRHNPIMIGADSRPEPLPHAAAPPMPIGYARVSTHDQTLDLQRDALKAAGCERVREDKLSGASSARPGLERLREVLREGDTLVVWRLDRLGRSLRDLIDWVGWLEGRGIGLRSLHEAIDTTTSSGKRTFHIFASLAKFERSLIRYRSQAGLAAARARGRRGGRKPALDSDGRALAVKLYAERQMPSARICKMMGISKPTLYAYVKAEAEETEGAEASR